MQNLISTAAPSAYTSHAAPHHMPTSVSLHSGWQFLEPKGRRWLAATVPGCIHTDLLRHKLIPDPFWGSNELELQWIEERDWSYRCEFQAPRALFEEEVIELVAEGLDTVAELRLNGKPLAKTENMFVAHRFDLTKRLQHGTNTLEIKFTSPLKYIRARQQPTDSREWNDPVGGSSRIRKEPCSFGWDWGPRFATSGIYLPIRLEAWSTNRYASVRVAQEHESRAVTVKFHPTLATNAPAHITGHISLAGKTVATIEDGAARITRPQLWWPNGHGDQPLYDVELELTDEKGRHLDTWHRRIGLRTVALDRHKDEWGESFQFVVNGRPIFAKGANWIPAHSFVTECTRALYDDLLTSAAEAHMNMIRVWGGGIYERDEFYDLCDEKGLLVWQDFMFACALYPGTEEFLALVRAEVETQIPRLAWRSCLALWCGNNELEQSAQEILRTPERQRAYEDVFYKLLPDAVARLDGVTTYWPSSPHNPDGYQHGHNNERAGDCHFWDVWHARMPVKTYEEKNFRFCSEFGMQSYSSPEVAATYCAPEHFNVFGPEFENHQKNAAGNFIILEYVSRLYRFPKDYAALAYLSQLNQAYCMRVGIEHFRRSMPRTMGALYWQLNDCWPVASWSSIEFGGTWKALHYAARRFFAPTLVSVKVLGEEKSTTGNYLSSTVHGVEIHTVHDAPEPATGLLRWRLEHLTEGTITQGQKKLTLRPGQSVKQITLDLAKELATHGADTLYLRADFTPVAEGVSLPTPLASNLAFFTAPRYLALDPAPIKTKVRQLAPREFELTLQSRAFHHAVQFHFKGTPCRASDNYVDLFPGEKRTIIVRTRVDTTAAALAEGLETMSLAGSYQ